MREIKAPEFVVKAKKAIVIEIQKGVELGMPQVEFDRLTKLFLKWSKDGGNMGSFLSELEPLRIYTDREIRELCTKHKKDISLMTQKAKQRDYFIILKGDGKYQLHPSLVEVFKKHF